MSINQYSWFTCKQLYVLRKRNKKWLLRRSKLITCIHDCSTFLGRRSHFKYFFTARTLGLIQMHFLRAFLRFMAVVSRPASNSSAVWVPRRIRRSTDPAEKTSIDGVSSPFFTSLAVRSRLLISFDGSTIRHELSTNLSGAM